jgi:N-methylhydantoinase A
VTSPSIARVGVDIGGTFTDVALEVGERRFTAKILTTTRAPEEGVLAAVRAAAGSGRTVVHPSRSSKS